MVHKYYVPSFYPDTTLYRSFTGASHDSVETQQWKCTEILVSNDAHTPASGDLAVISNIFIHQVVGCHMKLFAGHHLDKFWRK